MSAEGTIKSEASVTAVAELGKLAPPALRAGVLLASIANNVMANPRNAAIVAVLVIVVLPICWYWKKLRASHHERLGLERHAEASEHRSLDVLRERPDLPAGRTAVVDQHERVLVGHARVAVAESLESASLDQPSGRQLRASVRQRPHRRARMLALECGGKAG